DLLLQLRAGKPLLVILVPGGILPDIGDARALLLSLFSAVTQHYIAGNAEFHGRKSKASAPPAQVIDFLRDTFRRIAMHQVGVATARDQFFGGFRFAAGIDDRARARHRLGTQNGVLHFVVAALVAEVVAFPHLVHDLQPLRSAGIAIVVLLEMHAILARLVG